MASTGQLSVIAERLPDITRQGAPRPLRSMFINGIKSLPVRYTSWGDRPVAELGFWAIAAADPERVALVEADGTEHTAGQLHAACNQVVHGLRALGL